MARVETHRWKLASWRRALLAAPAAALLLAPYLVATREPYQALFWSGVVLLVFFAGWAGGRATWHYWVLRDLPAVEESGHARERS
jgi:hypothetical protein